MEDLVLKELKEELNWKERIILKIFRKTFSKICNTTRIIIINTMLK